MTTFPLYVGFIGPFGCGKTTLATRVAARLAPRNVPVLHFADPLKKGLASMGITKESTPALYRKTAQFVGASARAFDSEYWVDQFALFASPWHTKADVILVDDVRYQNEIDYIWDRGGLLFFVDAGKRIDLSASNRDHESEHISNLLHAELSSPHALDPVALARSPYLGQMVLVARNHENQQNAVAAKIVTNIVATLAQDSL